MKKHFIVISILLVLLSVGLSGCIDPLDINGKNWVMHTWDYKGDPIIPDRNVEIESLYEKIDGNYDLIYVIKEVSSGDVLFKGKPEQATNQIVSIEESPLTISIIYVDSSTNMHSDLPLIESLNPYTFTR